MLLGKGSQSSVVTSPPYSSLVVLGKVNFLEEERVFGRSFEINRGLFALAHVLICILDGDGSADAIPPKRSYVALIQRLGDRCGPQVGIRDGTRQETPPDNSADIRVGEG